MNYVDEVRRLIHASKYRDAVKVLDGMIAAGKEDDELWYLRGLVSLRLKNYDSAQEYFDRALFLKRKLDYYRIKGLAHFEIFELEEAVAAFQNAIMIDEKDLLANYFLALCYLFLDNPKSSSYFKIALKIDSKKTKQLLGKFYELFIHSDSYAHLAQKNRIRQKISSLSLKS